KVTARARYQMRDVDPFDVLDIQPTREPGWHRGRLPTPKQLECIKKFGVETPKDLSFWKASQLIGNLIARSRAKLCTYRQAKLLRKFGEDPNVKFNQASEIITAIKSNGWQPRVKQEV